MNRLMLRESKIFKLFLIIFTPFNYFINYLLNILLLIPFTHPTLQQLFIENKNNNIPIIIYLKYTILLFNK